MEKTHLEIIVVGAGPAGVTCSSLLQRSGKECLLIDKAEFPRNKVCGGGLTPKAHILLSRIYPTLKYDYYKVNSIYTYFNRKYICNFSLDTEIRTVVRQDFDHLLLKEYKQLGGLFLTDKLLKVEEKDKKVVVVLKSGRVLSCNYLIGADGANSIVRKCLQPGFSSGQVWMEKTSIDKSQDKMIVHFDKRIPEGYSYVFPNTRGHIVGYGEKHSGHEKFGQLLKEQGLEGSEKTKGAYIPMFDKLDYPFRESIILIGDAGGYADSMTGEGLYYALRSGENAALAILSGQDFKVQNSDIITLINKRRRMARLFYWYPINKLFMYMCTRPFLFSRINKRVNKELTPKCE
ncbi:NAD(P)/FAD-dependent oxidoreductase [Dysgonomonas sp. BGC7]|uniref:NAD(P)/FAD-dependent oxidoreductase n=1 Tax=Dysgonomonas sp. BGC7 TaxID=1658008 RepID=UPI00068296CC|nr:FAD-dependent monooxygenase [Dysgonomonas sp. BGC7]MBD8389467.1 FAD-dependent monooxygenase [Dysgonomonas sp. BGC7]